MFDLAVIGAGPAGLMAAAIAAEKGLKVVLIEKFKDISRINRACCQQFVMDEDYENENIRVGDGKIVFPQNGFEVAYDGPTHDVTNTCFISPKGRTVRFACQDQRAIAIKFDKGRLLQSLLDRCIRSGVDYRSSTLAVRASDLGECVEIQTRYEKTAATAKARKLIAADGVNSRMAEVLGLNRERNHIATALCIIYTLEGVQDFDPHAMKWHMGQAYFSYAPVIIDPSLQGDGVAELVVMGNARQRPDQIFDGFTTQGPTAHMYTHARVLSRTGCTVKAYNSIMVPCLGNVMAIGDSAAYVEVEVQGALMCGYQAGHAVMAELTGEKGFEHYTRWWQQTFEFNSEEALRVAQGYALVPTYADAEIDYLFSLIEDSVLDGAYGQYRAPRLLWDAIMAHRDKIERDNPDLYKKITTNTQMTLSDTFK